MKWLMQMCQAKQVEACPAGCNTPGVSPPLQHPLAAPSSTVAYAQLPNLRRPQDPSEQED